MARILTDESTLTRKRKSLLRESGALGVAFRVEAGLAALLIVAGLVVLFVKGSAAALIAGGVLAFVAAGHFIKIRENARESGSIDAGLKGEVTVTRVLAERLGNDAYILNDITVKSGFRSAQIDHVVVSPKGIFLLETKNWRGTIRGDERAKQWVREGWGKHPDRSVYNPVLQNQGHVEVFARFLKSRGVNWPEVHPLVVSMSPSAVWNIENQTAPILRPQEASDYIAYWDSPAKHSEQEVDTVINLLVKQR